MSSNRYIRFLHAAFVHVPRLPLSRCSHRFFRHTYTQHQLLTLLLFKKYLHATYRNVVDLVSLMYIVCDLLNLRTVPHFTTLQMFLARLSSGLLSRVVHHLAAVTLPSENVVSTVALDATGFTCDYAGDWYCERTGRWRKAFLILSVAVDTERLVILGFTMSRTPIHEVRHAPSALRQAYQHVRAPVYIMDNAYDAESIHRFIDSSQKT